MERVRRLAGHGLSERNLLTRRSPLTPDQIRDYGRYLESSPLYVQLVEVIAADNRLVDILNAIENVPRQNILFAGVQYLMTGEGGVDLARFYPNLTDSPLGLEGIAGPFADFVLEHADELMEIGRSRYTQTNECRRCVALLPGVWATPAERFHLVDFGASAGLNLQLDKYHYTWGDLTWGPDSTVALRTEIRGEKPIPRSVEVLSRVGLDLNPIDAADADDRRWLEALVWPEHEDRRRRLVAALDLAAANPPELIGGDATATLPRALASLPGRDPVVVMNSFILNQFAAEDRERFAQVVASLRETRPVYRVSMEWLDTDAKAAWLEVDDGSGLIKIGEAQPHGEWVELYARP